MRRKGHNPHDGPGKRTAREKPGPISTLGQIRRQTCWPWLYCRACGRGAPVALAPFIIRWGAHASSDIFATQWEMRRLRRERRDADESQLARYANGSFAISN
jgi:hypothetical protein